MEPDRNRDTIVTLMALVTARNIYTLGPGEHSDERIPGLRLRVTRTGARSFSLLFYRNRKRHRITLARASVVKARAVSLGDMRDKARQILSRLTLTGEVEGISARDGLTVGALCDRMMAGLALRDTTRRVWRFKVEKAIKPHLGAMPAMELTPADIRSWGEGLARRGGAAANQAFTVLRRAYSWAAQVGILQRSPFAGLRKPAPERASMRFLSIPELASLMRALRERPGMWSDVIWLVLYTATRRTAAASISRAEVVGDLWTIPPERAKRKAAAVVQLPHVVPLSRQVLAVLERRAQLAAGEYYFGQSGERPTNWGAANEYLARLRARMNAALGHRAPRWTIHNLRHTAATQMIEQLGIARDVVSLILGHTQAGPSATRIYDRAARLPERREALQRWADWLEGLTVVRG